MKERNIEYENKFRKYLFSGDFERHKEICKQINVRAKETEINTRENNQYCINYFYDEEWAFKSIYSYACFWLRKEKLTKKEFSKFINAIWEEKFIEQIRPFLKEQLIGVDKNVLDN